MISKKGKYYRDIKITGFVGGKKTLREVTGERKGLKTRIFFDKIIRQSLLLIMLYMLITLNQLSFNY